MKLNLGSGNNKVEGYINIDQNRETLPDIVLDLEKDCLPFDDNSVCFVLAYHILEHLGAGFFHCLRELHRVCQPNSIIEIRVPHPRHDIFLIDPTHVRPIYPHTLDMFSKERNKKGAETNSSETPLGIIHNVNFKVVDYKFLLDPYWETKFKSMSQEECDYVARSFNNVIAEILINLMVIKDEESG